METKYQKVLHLRSKAVCVCICCIMAVKYRSPWASPNTWTGHRADSTAGRGLASRHSSTKTLAVFTHAVRILVPVVACMSSCCHGRTRLVPWSTLHTARTLSGSQSQAPITSRSLFRAFVPLSPGAANLYDSMPCLTVHVFVKQWTTFLRPRASFVFVCLIYCFSALGVRFSR